MRIAFAGTPEYAAGALRALIAAGHEVALVLTQPDRPAGRGMRLTASSVKQVAVAHGIAVDQPVALKTAAAQGRLAEAAVELLVVAAYGLILPPTVLALPRLGCLNIHASLLPRWRGAAPIQRAILAGDRQTGVCIMQMDAGLDTGPILLRRALLIDDVDTAATLHDKLMQVGAQLIVEALRRLPELVPVPQPTDGVTYANKIGKQEAEIDWTASATDIERKVRALNPSPIAQTHLRGESLRIWRSRQMPRIELAPEEVSPGEIICVTGDAIVVACGRDALAIDELQKAGGKRLPTVRFLAGNPIHAGEVLGYSS